jgi:gliding motility-associated-like protein
MELATGQRAAPRRHFDRKRLLSATNTYGCADTSVKSLVVHALPLVSAGADQTICLGETALLQGSAGNYSWTPTAEISCTTCASPQATPSATTAYTLSTIDQFGCRATDSVIISVKQPFALQASLGDTLCLGKSLALFARGAELFTWSPALGLDDPRSPTPRAMPQTTTTFMVIGTDTKNCFSDTAYVPVVVYPYPTIDAGPDQTIQVGNSIPIKLSVSTDVTDIRWKPVSGLSCYDCSELIASPKTTTTYNVSVMNRGRCETRDDLTIYVICKNGNLFLPNSFSPNGDGSNDVFYPRGKGIYGVKSLKIFNRWGELVFQRDNFPANDGASGWNGKYKGREASQDVYVYMVEVICENNQVLFFKGDVTLVR